MRNLNYINYLSRIFLILSLSFPLSAFSEYRVYQYYVKSTLSSPKDGSSYLVTSTLDPITYVTYHGGSDTIKVDLLRSWTCEGYTGGHNEYCDSPIEAGKVDRGTASEGVGL